MSATARNSRNKNTAVSAAGLNSGQRGFSLVEILAVMTILGLLAAITWAGFYGMRNAMILHQNAESFRSDVVFAQRSAMLLDRDIHDTWIHGVGVDMSSMSTNGTYTLFKWCSDGSYYSNFDETALLPNATSEVCRSNARVPIEGKRNVELVGGDMTVFIDALTKTGNPEFVDYILFESVTGRVHYYRPAAEGDQPQPISELEWARVTYDRANRYDSVKVSSDGLVLLETYDPEVESPADQ